MSREPIRRSLRRFGVELLCLLMVLYGAPLQALEVAGGQEDREFDAAPPDPPSSKADGDRDDTAREDTTQSAEAAEAFEAAVAAKDHLEGIPLYPGYNLVSLPEEPSDPDPATVFAPITGSYVEVFAHDVCDTTDEDGWQRYDPADPAASDLLAVDPTQGLWIEATAPAVLPSDGTLPATTSWQLCQGWNLIGFPAAQPRPVRSALQSIDGKYVRIFGYDASDADDPWEIWDVAVPDWANDLRELRPGFGYWLLVTEDVTLEIANEGEPPEVAFTAPADLAEVTAPTEIRGTVESQLLDSWSLAYRFVGETEWTELGSGNVPVADGSLATFDPTLLLNGLYEIRLRAVDFAGVAVEETMAVVVDGQMKIGHFTLSFVDLAIPLSGLDVEVVRTYDSRQRQMAGDFGHGWTLDVRQGSYRNNRPPGDGWRIPAAEGPWGLPCSTVQETKSHLTTVRLSDREVYRFRLVLENPATVTGGCFAEATFEWVDGPLPGTTLEILGGTQVFAANGSDAVVVPDTQEPFVPEDVKLTTRDGRIFHLDLAAGVTRVEDLNGNALEITPDGITHSSGRGVDFERDAAGRIVAITDPLGRSNLYEHNEAGDLVAFTDRAEAVTRFSYGAGHFLEEVENALGVRAVRTEYDDDGRMVLMVDADGQTIAFDHDLDARREVVTNRLGHTRVLEYDDRGNVVRETDELGHVTVRTFDAEDRLLTETDPLGNTTTNIYDADGDLTSVTDPLDQTTAFTYDDAGRVIATTLPDDTTTRTEYDALGRRTAEVDAAGVRTEFAYDALGRLVEVTDALGGTTLYSYDEQGNRVAQTDANGHTTRFGYDALGRQTSRTLPDGATETSAYDAAGNRTRHTDFNGATVTYDHDADGRLTRRGYPDGTAVTFTYTPTGRRATVTDGRGVTRYAYDDRDRLVSMTAPEGWSLHYAWDEAGNRTTLTAELGEEGSHTTAYAHDAAGRLTTVTDPQGGVYTHGYDAAGRSTSLSYPNGVETSYVHDAAGRLLSLHTEGPDGTVIQDYAYTLGPTGQRQSVTEHDGMVRSWEYDALYRLTRERVVDGDGVLVYENAFTYDPVGNRTEQVRTGADGSSQTIVYAYDARDRLLSESVAADPVTSYGWDANGNLVSKVESGTTTTYNWDAENRLHAVTLPDGTEVSHGYDADGVWVARAIQHPGEPTETTVFVTDTAGSLSQIVAELEEGALAAQYVRSDRLLALLRSGADRYVHADGVGSVRMLTGDGAESTDRYVYEAFGALVEHAGEAENPYRFAGEYFESAGELAHHRARWMNPNIGRFLSVDPETGLSRSPLSHHRYLYAHASPVSWVDPTGRFASVAELSLVAAFRAELVGIQADVGFVLIEGAARGGNLETSQVLFALASSAVIGVAAVGVVKLVQGVEKGFVSGRNVILERMRAARRGDRQAGGEIRAAVALRREGRNVHFRRAAGDVEAQGSSTSDFLVDGVRGSGVAGTAYEVYTPKTSNRSRMASRVGSRQKSRQAERFILDLDGGTSLLEGDLGNFLLQVNSIGGKTSTVKEIIIVRNSKIVRTLR